MTAQSVAPRSRTAQRGSEPDDLVLARAIEFSQWAKRNARVIIGVAVVLALAIGGFIWYRIDRAQTMERAAAEFLQLEQTTLAASPALAIPDLQAFVQRFDGTPYADEARVQLGQIQLQQGDAAAAVETLRPMLDRIRRSPVGAQGALLLAAAQASAGDAEGAVSTFVRVSDQAEFEFQQREALHSAALLREEQGNLAGAAEMYRRLIERAEEGSMERAIYEMRLAEVEARLPA